MSSKTETAKRLQEYVQKAVPRTCSTCQHFAFKRVPSHVFQGKQYYSDKELRCRIGDFAVRKTATCKYWEQKGDE